MARLPVPDSDDNAWGDILNAFLRVGHNDDGTPRVAPFVARGTWTVQTAYSANDLVQFQGASFLCLNAHTSSPNVTGQAAAFETDFAAGKWQQQSARSGWFDVRDYGARLDNAANDTTSVQAAIDACASAGGGTVFIPPGTAAVTTLVLKNKVWLRGAGMRATTIRCLSNTNNVVIKNFVSPDGIQANAEFCAVLDLTIDGNKTGNSGAGAHGISFSTNPLNTQATNDDQFDTHHLVQNVRIVNCAGIGLNATGRSEMRLSHIYAAKCDGGGISPSFDTFLSNCDADNCGAFGFSFTHGNIMAVNCKAFLSGRDAVLNSPGFVIGGSVVAITLASCIAQNNNGQGFYINGVSGVTLAGCAADSNNYGPGNSASAYAGLELNNAKNCVIDLVSTQGFQSGNQIGNQASALRLSGGSDSNDIRVTTYAQTGYTLGPTHTADSVLLSNRITANGALLNPLPKLTDDGDVAIASPADGQVLQYATASGKWINSSAPAGSFTSGMLGDGSDGSVTLDGTITVPWASKNGNIYSLTRDVLATALTVNNGVTLVVTGFRVFCQGTLTNNGTISANGNNATSATGAAASTSRSLQSGTKGGNGNTGAGTAGNNAPGGFAVGTGGTGGTGTGGVGGVGGTIGNAQTWAIKAAQSFATGSQAFGGSVVALSGGSGGGGGGGDGTNAGGGGGTGGSMVCLFARSFVNNSTLTAIGGSGFGPATGNCGGGAGGGGGLIAIFSVNPWTNNGTTSVTGGAGGAGSGSGTAGASGTAGSVLAVQLQ